MLRKIEVDEKAAAAKIDLQEAEALAISEGKFMPPREHAAMRRNLAYLQRESQRLQFELRGDRKNMHDAKDNRTDEFLRWFLLAAQRLLPKEQYAALCKEAESKLAAEQKT